MKSSPWRTVLLVFCFLALYFVASRPATPPEGWGTDFDAGLADAKSSGKHLILNFYMEGCGPCVYMDREILVAEKVKNELKSFVPIRVDADKERELANRFGVLGTPTFAVVTWDQRLVAKSEGMQQVDDFVRFLRLALPDDSVVTLTPQESMVRSSGD